MSTTVKPKTTRTPRTSAADAATQPAKAVRSTKGATYIEAIGRRKTAIARVRAVAGTKTVVTVNDQTFEKYFGTPGLRAIVSAPLSREGFAGKYAVSVHVKGGGIHAQAEAVRHGLSRILVKEDAEQKGELKKLGFLKRDSRKVERKHFGLKKARKASQWSKR
jgi:small subunit ribosomal protein S9